MSYFYNHQYNYQAKLSKEDFKESTEKIIDKAQQNIYRFFSEIVRTHQTEEILNQFERLFINYVVIDDEIVYSSLGEIILYDKEEEFKYTLIRCCYILNNNWSVHGNASACQQLVNLFLSNSIGVATQIHKLKKLRIWLQRFVNSEEYQNLRSLSAGTTVVRQDHHTWIERFSSYLLISEWADSSKPLEYRQQAELLSIRLKKQFKFELAMYTAKIGSKLGNNSQNQKNPTSLGDGVLLLIKQVLNKQGDQSFRKLAQAFYKEICHVTFGEFKERLLLYLGISPDNLDIPEIVRISVSQRLQTFHAHQDDELMTLTLLHITCNRIFQYLLLNKQRQPSGLLRLAIESNHLLTLSVLLLKIVLIFPNIRFYLENYIAELIRFYSNYNEIECRSFINFLDILNVTLAIFDEDTDYNLVKMNNDSDAELTDLNSDNYRVFSQSKKEINLVNQTTVIKDQSQAG